MALFMYRIVCMRVKYCLVDLFTRHLPRKRVRGDAKDLELSFMSKGYGIISFRVQGAREWNFLPAEIRYLPSLSRYKFALKRYFSDLD